MPKFSVDIVIPVLNEEHSIERCVIELSDFILSHSKYNWLITVADNGSTDKTLEIATDLSAKYKCVRSIHIGERGRGRAIKRAWEESEADVRCYMDVDLSSDIGEIPNLVKAIVDEGYDLVVGSRLIKGSKVIDRTILREITSRGYNLLIKLLFWPPFHDAQCGFKAISRRTADNILPLVEDNAWFLDTELLLLAAAAKYKIKEIPVVWRDDPDSRVNVISTAWADIKGLLRLRFGGRPTPDR